MRKKTKIITRLRKNNVVITIGSMHSHVTLGMLGTIEDTLPNGYAVNYPRTIHTALFGGGKVFKPATVFMRPTDIRYYTHKDRMEDARKLAEARANELAAKP